MLRPEAESMAITPEQFRQLEAERRRLMEMRRHYRMGDPIRQEMERRLEMAEKQAIRDSGWSLPGGSSAPSSNGGKRMSGVCPKPPAPGQRLSPDEMGQAMLHCLGAGVEANNWRIAEVLAYHSGLPVEAHFLNLMYEVPLPTWKGWQAQENLEEPKG